MAEMFEVVDLFAGPGGLGEGFSKVRVDGKPKFQTSLSIEMDKNAVNTLKLRSFLRGFETFPKQYYEALRSNITQPNWSEIYPSEWLRAENEVLQCTLGEPGVADMLKPKIDAIRERASGNTILIGGPPCQAYSIAGRSRNKGNSDYIPEDDNRHYLYREYVRILDNLRPAAFIMENVKGMLSSSVDGGRIFTKVLEDLTNAGDGYDLIPLSQPCFGDWRMSKATDFIVKAECHGIPQARHRVFVLGIRKGLNLKKKIL